MLKKTVSETMLVILLMAFWLVASSTQSDVHASNSPNSETDVYVQWDRTYGGSAWETTHSMIQTSDGGYVFAGQTDSFGAGSGDFWLVKTDSSGNMQWNKTYGGAYQDVPYSMIQMSDGGFAIAGITESFGAGAYDFWLVKTDSSGIMQWNKTYGGADYEYGYCAIQASDGGYVLAGSTYSFGAGDNDAWLVKTDSFGIMQWNKTYGGAYHDNAFRVIQASDGGYVLAGSTYSFGAGSSDVWLVRTDSSGIMQWNKTYGGAYHDESTAIQAIDGGYILTGNTKSFGAGAQDWWLVRTDSSGIMQWNKTYGGAYSDIGAYSFVHSSDGGYVLAGYTESFGAGGADVWLVRTDSSGIMQWNKTYGGPNHDYANWIIQTCDGGYALAGHTESYGAGGGDIWLIKLGLLDVTPPTTSLFIGEPKYVSDATYVTPDTPFTLEAADTGSGVDSTAYRICNATYNSGWLTYTAPFTLASLADGVYAIQYNSTDNAKNIETPHEITVTLFSWNHTFEDTQGRRTTLKINLAHRFFQFITPDKDYGIRKATCMRVHHRTITIRHEDNELKLITLAVDTKLDFCVAKAWDKQTRKQYLLIDKPGIE